MGIKRHKLWLVGALITAALAAFVLYVRQTGVAVFEPAGTVAEQERQLIFTALGLSLIVVLPVFALTFGIAWKYRAGNTKAKYQPDWDHDRRIEAVWWLVPSVLIAILSVITWRSSHQLDPYRPLAASTSPLTIQAVALDWKWLFIYPEQGIASVNLVRFPAGRPVDFQVTADAPMNSFWIPRLGGQIYAMPGMSTQLHLMADDPGSYRGSSANISGRGFAGMDFAAEATTASAFDTWVDQARATPERLDLVSYNRLAAPSRDQPVKYYSRPADGLYDVIVMKFMQPLTSQANQPDRPGVSL